MVITPWSTAAIDAIAGAGTEVVVTARVTTAAGVEVVADVPVQAGQLTMDEGWQPYAQATLTIPDPGVTIDDKAGHRCIISAGYVYGDGTRDVHTLADLGVVSSDADAAPGTLVLTLASDEQLVAEGAYWGDLLLPITWASTRAAVVDLLGRALAPAVPVIEADLVSAFDPHPDALTGHVIDVGDEWWPHLRAIVDAAGMVLWCDETRTWRLRIAETSITEVDPLVLATGVQLTDASVSSSRDEWANLVVLDVRWNPPGGSAGRLVGRAYATGALAPGVIGAHVKRESRAVQMSQADADAAAEAILWRALTRGLVRTLTCPVAWWIRPRQSVRSLVRGVAATDWCVRVRHDLAAHTTTLTTRRLTSDV